MCLSMSHSHVLRGSFHFLCPPSSYSPFNPLKYPSLWRLLWLLQESWFFLCRVPHQYVHISATELILCIYLLTLTSFKQRTCFISSFYLQFPVRCLPHVKAIIREWNPSTWVGCSGTELDGRRKQVVEAPASRILLWRFKLQFCYF